MPRTRCSLGRLLAVWVLSLVVACGSSTEEIVVLTTDGGVFIGQVETADGDTVVIRDAEGTLHAIDRTTIVSMGQPTGAGTEPDEDVTDGAVADADGEDTVAPEAPPPEPVPAYRDVVVPGGTQLTVELDASLSTATDQEGDSVSARLVQPVVIDGLELVPAGTRLVGVVSVVRPPGEDGRRSRLVFRFTELRHAPPAAVAITTSDVDLSGPVTTTNAGGVVGTLGRIVGRGRREVALELTLEAGTSYEVSLLQPITVSVLVTSPPARR